MKVLRALGGLSSLTNNFASEKPLSLYLQLRSSLRSQTEASLTSRGRLRIESDENLPMRLQSAIVTFLPTASSKAQLTSASVLTRSLLSGTPNTTTFKERSISPLNPVLSTCLGTDTELLCLGLPED